MKSSLEASFFVIPTEVEESLAISVSRARLLGNI